MSGKALRARLPRSQRLQQSREFKIVREQGRRSVKGCMIVNWMPLPESSVSRLGVVTSRKIGKATARTRARRLFREVFRLHQHSLRGPVAIVMVARPSVAGKAFRDVELDFLSIMRQSKLMAQVG